MNTSLPVPAMPRSSKLMPASRWVNACPLTWRIVPPPPITHGVEPPAVFTRFSCCVVPLGTWRRCDPFQ